MRLPQLPIATACVMLTACTSAGWPTRPDPAAVSGTPDRFLVLDAATDARSVPAGSACRNPMVDPRDGTRLTLVRSVGGLGDYRPEVASYGLAHDQLLRIDCASGQALGAVPAAG